MEKQEKQLKIVMEEINLIQGNHEKITLQCKQRLQLKDSAKVVIEAIKGKTTNRVTGGDMAQLMKAMENDDLFKNILSVEKAINNRNKLLKTLVGELNTLVSKYKLQESSLLRPDQIPNVDTFTVDIANSHRAIVDGNGVITAKKDL